METEILKNALLLQLCRHFRLDYDAITPIEKIEMLYIHDRLSVWLQTEELPLIFEEVERIADSLIKARSKRKRLYSIYRHINAKNMTDSGRYDTDTLKPPTTPVAGNYY